MNEKILLGCDESLLEDNPILNCRLQAPVNAALRLLQQSAQAAGFELKVASSYRSFARQLVIWNAKAGGQRPVLDDRGLPLDITALGERELMFAILRWSALPGASRHHWGTDLDVYDGSRIPADYQLQLTKEETEGEGPFAQFHRWLDDELLRSPWFYRPYAQDRGGVAPEPWHLSYAPLAHSYMQALTLTVLRQHITDSDILLKNTILNNLDEIYQRFIKLD